MIVKELFLSVGFDNILKALRNTHRNDRSIEGVVAYKEAFDIICLTEFEGDGGEVSFDVTPREKWSEPHALPLIANNVEGDYWKNTVGKTVVKPKDNPFFCCAYKIAFATFNLNGNHFSCWVFLASNLNLCINTIIIHSLLSEKPF